MTQNSDFDILYQAFRELIKAYLATLKKPKIVKTIPKPKPRKLEESFEENYYYIPRTFGSLG